MKFEKYLDKIDDEDFFDDQPRKKAPSIPQNVRHPFFMAPSERAAHRLTQHIQESNALNRAIQINLVSDDDDEEEDSSKNINPFLSNGFFQKRVKTTSGHVGNCSINLKKISCAEAPPFPLEFQFPKNFHESFEAIHFSPSPLIIKAVKPVLKPFDQSTSFQEIVPLAQLIKETFSEINIEGLKRLNNIVSDRSIGISTPNRQTFSSILNDIEVNLSSDQSILWVFTGPPGVGKTKLVEDISEALNLRLITIDSTQSPRNSKTFETLHTTLTHSAPRSFSQFFSTPEKHKKTKHKVALLFDEVEIAFENDRGFWSALTLFLQSPVAKTVPIFITSNAPITFLETIIRFPDHFRIFSINDGDYRKSSINTDFIGRLHRIDTSIEYEQLAMTTGYHVKPDKLTTVPDDISESEFRKTMEYSYSFLIEEALTWNGILENISVGSMDINAFSYAEYASFADLLLSISESSVKINIDNCENIHSEFFAHDATDIPILNTALLYSNLPEIYNDVPETCVIARELLEKSIHPFIAANLNTRQLFLNNSSKHTAYWKDLSKRLAIRFFDYTKSIQSPRTWLTELSSHIVNLETDNYLETFSRNRGRRKRAYYRYIGEELLNEILNLYNEDNSLTNKKLTR